MDKPSKQQTIEERHVKVRQTAANWAAFDEWMANHGCENLAEALRVLMQQVVEQEGGPDGRR